MYNQSIWPNLRQIMHLVDKISNTYFGKCINDKFVSLSNYGISLLEIC